MKTKSKAKRKINGIVIDSSLDKYVNMPIFQEKLDEANKTLKRVGVPGEKKKTKKG